MRLRSLLGTLPRGLPCLPVSVTRCLPPGFQGPVGRAFSGWRLVWTHRNAYSPGREPALPTPQPRTSSSRRHPFPLLPSVLEQTPDLQRRALGGRERKAPETEPAIHPAPSCTVAPNCLFIKGPVCKLANQYKRAEHACCLKIHPSKLRR